MPMAQTFCTTMCDFISIDLEINARAANVSIAGLMVGAVNGDGFMKQAVASC